MNDMNITKRTFKALSILTVFALVLNLMTVMWLVRAQAAAITSASATLTRLQISTSTSIDISYTMPAGEAINGDEDLVIDFGEDSSAWAVDGASLTTADIDVAVEKSSSLTDMTVTEISTDGTMDCGAAAGTTDNQVQVDIDDTTGILTIRFCDSTATWTNGDTAGDVDIEIGTAAGGTNRITNPATVNEYELSVDHNSGEGTGEIAIAIVDDDTVNVSGFIDTFLTFDIDTASTDVDCDASGGASPCDSHSGASDDAGYVVDLGELTTSDVRNSGDSGVTHADALTGDVNFIWFDTDSNASNGVAVTVTSFFGLNDVDGTPDNSLSALENSGNTDEIRSVATGEVQITAASGLYGIAFPTGGTNTVGSGSAATIGADYDQTGGADFYGAVPSEASGGTGSPLTIFSSTGPLASSRVQFAVAAAPDTQDGTGTYQDELTFIATSTF